jgi:DNA primase
LKFDQDFIEKVRDATNIVDLISQHVELKRSGNGFVGLCPFHGDKTPSLSVSEDKKVYHCFACKASGSVVQFVENYQGLTFPETIEYLAKRAGIPLPEAPSANPSQNKDKKDILLRINDYASKFFQAQLQGLQDDHQAWVYLRGRGITREFAAKNRLGFAPDAWTALAYSLETKKVPLYLAANLGLIRKRNTDDGYYDLFRNRIIFPIYSPTDACLAFGGRVLDDSQPKYLNSPDSPIFHKGQVFYGLDKAAKHIRTADTAILVEGYTDCLALVRAGFQNVVATLGTAFTPNHAHLLTRYCANVIVLFDGDEPGRLAARRSLTILLNEELYPKGVILPYDLDPDEFIDQHGAPALKASLERAVDLYDLVVEEEARNHTGEPSEKIQILDRLGPILMAVKDLRLRELYINSTANYLNIDQKLVRQTLKGAVASPVAALAPQPQRIAPSSTEVKVIEVIKPPRSELDLLSVALLKEAYLKEIISSEVIPLLGHSGIQAIFVMMVEAYGQMLCKFDNLTALLVSQVKPSEVVTRQLVEPFLNLTDEAAKKLIHDCIRRIRETFLRSQSKVLVTNLRGAQGDEQREKLEQIMNIYRNRRQLNQEN